MGQRTETGIKGFDRLVQGGFPEGFTVLITGTPGTGKTLFALEYLYNGAKRHRQKSMLITLEQSLDDIRTQAKGIGMDLETLEKKGMLTLMHIPANALAPHTIDDIKKEMRKRKIKRLVIDSLSTLAINAPIYTPIKDITLRDIMNYKAFFSPPILGDFVVKRFIYGFLEDLKSMRCTTLVTSEAPENGSYLSRDTISEFLCDGVLQLTFESMGGQFSRSLIVRKMRGTDNDEDVHPLEISSKGLKLHDVK
ncbi:AAA family ATPase [Candidatus Woesearchaeota archaeon]|nr:AAA family ATPase [Candidatus Woesearchaeota archaeon]